MVIALFVNVVMHFGVRHRRAKEVTRADGEANFFANGGELFRTLNDDLEFRLLVFLNFEVAAGFCVSDGGRDVIAAKWRFITQV